MFALRLMGITLAVSGAAQAASLPPLQRTDEERVICRRIAATGSINSREKICRPETFWKKPMDRGRRSEREYREDWLPPLKNVGQSIDVGSANWDKLPALKAKQGHLPYKQLIETVEDMLRKEQCKLPGQTRRAFNIEVPYAVLVEPNGTAKRVLVPQLNCEGIQSLVGVTVLARAQRGDFEPTGEGKARWYGGRMNFTLE